VILWRGDEELSISGECHDAAFYLFRGLSKLHSADAHLNRGFTPEM